MVTFLFFSFQIYPIKSEKGCFSYAKVCVIVVLWWLINGRNAENCTLYALLAYSGELSVCSSQVVNRIGEDFMGRRVHP